MVEEKDTSKLVSRYNLASDFIRRLNNKLKIKFTVKTLRHAKVGLCEPQSKDKGKMIINEVKASNA